MHTFIMQMQILLQLYRQLCLIQCRYTYHLRSGSGMLNSLVQPLLDSSEHGSVLLFQNLRYLGTVRTKTPNHLLCLWGKGVQELSSFRVLFTLEEEGKVWVFTHLCKWKSVRYCEQISFSNTAYNHICRVEACAGAQTMFEKWGGLASRIEFVTHNESTIHIF